MGSDIPKLIRELARDVCNGDADAVFRLAYFYHIGKHVEQNLVKAKLLLERAHKLGHPQASKMLDHMEVKTFSLKDLPDNQLVANHTEENSNSALQRLSFSERERLAQQGNVHAQATLATYYRIGTFTSVDYKNSFHWYHHAAQQGHADAQCNLGCRYGTGLGVKKNYTKALHWYTLSAQQCHKIASKNIEVLQREFNQTIQEHSISFDEENFTVANDSTLEINSKKCCIYIKNQKK